MSPVSRLASATALEMNAGDRHRIARLPVLVLFPHNRCNCRCVMCDIWRIRETREIRPDDVRPHLDSFQELGVQWIVLSGGEPLMHSDFGNLCRVLRFDGVRLTLLTAGMSLERHAAVVAESVDDVIVSLDGPAGLHDKIRAVPNAYQRLERGVRRLRCASPEIAIHARCTVQKTNFTALRGVVRTAHELELNSVSFLAADVTSTAFNRAEGWSATQKSAVALTPEQLSDLSCEIEALILDCAADIETGFVVEKPEKLRRIVRHFQAQLGEAEAVAPRCNAPWVSAVIEADGTVRPCFFHRPIGNFQTRSLPEILNGPEAIAFRQSLDVATNPTCKNCVCSLYMKPQARNA